MSPLSPVDTQVISVSKDGVERCLEFRSVPFFKDGEVVKAQGVIRDITDHMKAEEKLKRMFESMTDNSTCGWSTWEGATSTPC